MTTFYRNLYPNRSYPLAELWEWLYRPSMLEFKIPLVMELNDQVIAHAGMIPFEASIEGENHLAAWYVDFGILPEYQRKGLGNRITHRWMDIPDIHITFCNEKSIGIFKKLGWIESFNTNLFYYFIDPFNHPKFTHSLPNTVRKTLNRLSRIPLKTNYRRFSAPLTDLKFTHVDEDSLKKFLSLTNSIRSGSYPIRNEKYISWRFLASPYRHEYFIVSVEDSLQCIVKRRRDKSLSPHIDILWVSDPNQETAIKRLISTLALWCSQNDFSYIRHYVSHPEKMNRLKQSLKPIVRHPRFAYYSKNPKMLEKLKKTKWHLELMDSDFEFTQ